MYLLKYQLFSYFLSNYVNLPKYIKSVLMELMYLKRFDCNEYVKIKIKIKIKKS